VAWRESIFCEPKYPRTFKQPGLRVPSRQLCHCVMGGIDVPLSYQGAGPQIILMGLTTRCTPTVRLLIVLILPPRYRCRLDWSLGSCPRAAGWSAATSCYGAISTVCAGEIRSPLRVEGGSRWIRNRVAHESRRDLPVAAGLARCACGTAPPHRDRLAGRDGVVNLALSSSAFLTASRFNFETN
jgi:hypothetical protein